MGGLVIINQSNEQMCRVCGGECCQRYPGSTSPEDWGAPDKETMLSRLVAAFRTGKWAIDWWEGDPLDDGTEHDCVQCGEFINGYYVRPATIKPKYQYSLRDPSWGGVCVFWSKNTGCWFALDKRPEGCRVLKPNKPGRCLSPSDSNKHGHAIRWMDYHDVIFEAERLALAK